MALTVGMLAFPAMTQLDLTGPHEVFWRMPDTKVVLMAPRLDGQMRSESVCASCPIARWLMLPHLDILFVPGGTGMSAWFRTRKVSDFCAIERESARYVTSVCTGALVLGAAGLLRGYRATTHWLSLDLLPLVGAIPISERIVIDRNRITAGGITAGIDFGLTVAAEIRGQAAAEQIQAYAGILSATAVQLRIAGDRPAGTGGKNPPQRARFRRSEDRSFAI